ncbi:MAG: RluA family pseudouridine synthase, partial [Clostridia bacterium]|nr:RluA family pseudouridine synthase [Deltaproteobacteria bacterium]
MTKKFIIVELTVDPANDGQRLDKFLAHRFSKLSRTRIQSFIERDLASDRPMKASSTVRTGMVVRMRREIEDEPETPTAFATLYLDDTLLVIDKPAGLPVHPSARYHSGTVTGRITERYGPGFASPVHRLDRETSGVLVCARTPGALRSLSDDFFHGRVHKTYVAIVHGHPAQDDLLIDAPIANGSALVRIAMRIDSAGKPSRTQVHVVRRFVYDGKPMALVEASPLNGRQHQIRVHLAHVGHGLIGDKLYPDD